jgi:multidrug resistance efflux pump
MNRKLLLPIVAGVLVVGAIGWSLARRGGTAHYTGFVEGEERVIRSEVVGRVVEVAFAEGATVPAGGVLVRLDDDDVRTRIEAKHRELAVLEADVRTQEERIILLQSTWERDVAARRADLRQAVTAAEVAERTLGRERDLVKTGASTAQLLDDARMRRDQARSQLERARAMEARTVAEERQIAVAKQELASLGERRELLRAQLKALEVEHAKYTVRAPAVATVVQTQLIWPGELAQPGTGLVTVIDPVDKYVQVYVPVADVDHFRVGRKVEIELDSDPGRRVPGEVSFVADKASFTPEKIETRSDRVGQVYRAKIRILDGVERFQPGTEGNVYLVEETA